MLGSLARSFTASSFKDRFAQHDGRRDEQFVLGCWSYRLSARPLVGEDASSYENYSSGTVGARQLAPRADIVMKSRAHESSKNRAGDPFIPSSKSTPLEGAAMPVGVDGE